MLKMALTGLIAVFLSMAAGNVKREYGYLTAVVASVFIFSYGLSKIRIIVDQIQRFEEVAGIRHEYLVILLKMAGISYLCQFVVSLCRDAGQGAVAGQINFAGKISILLISMPVLRALVETIGDFFL